MVLDLILNSFSILNLKGIGGIALIKCCLEPYLNLNQL
ncbi:hypothetical protein OUI_0181 [Helicobacter pylori R036d]|uniref:Uncharacterized protein n=1 Tax=Helicobacter pylori R036d TaxID=1145113 RepID=K2JWT3_HELPX|nr:hypothetical protein OUI_0181 [Helicobacter pylori R036d]